eukprot:6195932-Alexandrium_andersonii.AAC.1
MVVAIHKLHKAAGHPNNRNLARTLKDAGQPRWVQKLALEHKCSQCDELKQGNYKIPNASLSIIPKPWEFIGMD